MRVIKLPCSIGGVPIAVVFAQEDGDLGGIPGGWKDHDLEHAMSR